MRRLQVLTHTGSSCCDSLDVWSLLCTFSRHHGNSICGLLCTTPAPPRDPFTTQDLVLNFVTAKFDESSGRWKFSVSELFRSYASKWFWIDLVSHGGARWAHSLESD
jgi:hypothetical protein